MSQIFSQQDGARGHTALATQNLLSERLPHFWTKDMRPVNSPDLSPIEILWAILGERIKQISNPSSTSPGLEKALKDAWKKISTETLRIWLSLCMTESRQSEWPMEKFLYTSLKKNMFNKRFFMELRDDNLFRTPYIRTFRLWITFYWPKMKNKQFSERNCHVLIENSIR